MLILEWLSLWFIELIITIADLKLDLKVDSLSLVLHMLQARFKWGKAASVWEKLSGVRYNSTRTFWYKFEYSSFFKGVSFLLWPSHFPGLTSRVWKMRPAFDLCFLGRKGETLITSWHFKHDFEGMFSGLEKMCSWAQYYEKLWNFTFNVKATGSLNSWFFIMFRQLE